MNNSARRSRWWCVLAVLLHPRCLFLLLIVFLTTVTALVLVTQLNQPEGYALEERSYGVVIDAGSSSSKIHLFQWPPHDGDPGKLLTIKPVVDELGDPRIKKVEPGISAFANNPETAFTSIQPLLEFALKHIPPSHHQHTSLYIFGTAGLRLLPKEKQDTIMETLYERTSQQYPFYFPRDGVQVISGKMEGAFSWIALNYLLGRLTPEHHHNSISSSKQLEGISGNNEVFPASINTVGCLDMGGASLQLAFEIPHNIEVSSDYTVDINLGCGVGGEHQHRHKIVVSTYLGYGTNKARARYYQHLLKTHLENSNQTHLNSPNHLHSLRDPCSPLDSLENITVDGHTIKIRGLGDFRGCKKALLPLMQNSSGDRGSGEESNVVRSFQRPPSLKYESLDFYGTSEFWYTMRDIFRIGGHYTAYSFEKVAMEYCQTNWKVLLDRFRKNLYVYADHYRLKSQCMKSAWLSLILHEGLGFPDETISLHSVASIKGQSVQWALGALLYNTRYLPLREVQLHQLQSPPPPFSQWGGMYTQLSSLLQSSFLLPFLMVLFVALLLLCCRHRRRPYPSPPPTSPDPLSIHRSQSLNSLVKIHRRMGSVTGSSLHIAMDDPDGRYGNSGAPPPAAAAAVVGSGFTQDFDERGWSNTNLKFTV